MTANPILGLVRLDDHRQRIPADEALDAAFNLAAAWERWFFCRGDGVDVGGVCGEWLPDAFALRMVGELTQQTTDPRGSAGLKHVIERLEPFAGFERFELGRILRGSVPH